LKEFHFFSKLAPEVPILPTLLAFSSHQNSYDQNISCHTYPFKAIGMKRV